MPFELLSYGRYMLAINRNLTIIKIGGSIKGVSIFFPLFQRYTPNPGRSARLPLLLPAVGLVAAEPGITVNVRPVYARALAAFICLGARVAARAVIGVSLGRIPLDPREVNWPPYPVSNSDIRYFNMTNVTNITNVTNDNEPTLTSFVNRGAATASPAMVMTLSQPLARQGRPITPWQLAAARPVTTVRARPTAVTAGVTLAAAPQLKLPLGPQAPRDRRKSGDPRPTTRSVLTLTGSSRYGS
jgi:hypothetical protein